MTRFSALALVLLAAGTAHASEKTFDRTFTVSPGGSLTVEADGASVKVSGTSTNQVVVRMWVRGSERDLDAMVLDATQSGNDVKATMRKSKTGKLFNWDSWRDDSSIEVTVPRNYDVSVRTGGGGIDVKDTVGSVKLNTSGGDISANNLKGTVKLRTSGGKITAEDVSGDVDADTSGGDVRLLGIDGQIKSHTSGGNVRIKLVGANRGISATTSGGDVELTLPQGTTGNVRATTGGGKITTDFPVTTTEIKEGRLVGTLNGGGQSIDARTSGGDIRIRSTD